MLRFLKDPLVRRVITGSLFAVAFVWVAITQFDVGKDVVWVFATLAFALVGLLMVAGFFSSFLLHFFMRRKGGGMLDRFEEELEEERSKDGESGKGPGG